MLMNKTSQNGLRQLTNWRKHLRSLRFWWQIREDFCENIFLFLLLSASRDDTDLIIELVLSIWNANESLTISPFYHIKWICQKVCDESRFNHHMHITPFSAFTLKLPVVWNCVLLLLSALFCNGDVNSMSLPCESVNKYCIA